MSEALDFRPEALAEIECATGDYEARTPGLGVRFREVVESTCAAIVQHPLLWRERSGEYRRVNLPGFSYYVAFVVRDALVTVVAVAHTSRRPEYWFDRMP